MTESRGEGYLDAARILAGEVRIRDICLAQVKDWIEGERTARSIGAPGA